MKIVNYLNKIDAAVNTDDISEEERSKKFNSAFNSMMRAVAKELGGEWIKSGGYCYCSGFLKVNNKFLYICSDDYRFGNWKNILYRTAKDEHDHIGGHNMFCTIDKLPTKLKIITGGSV